MDSPSGQRCKRSAGLGKWRCSEMALPSSSYCEKHLQRNKQAQKRIRGDGDNKSHCKSRKLKRSRSVRGEISGLEMNKKKKRREEELSGGSEEVDELVLTEMMSRERQTEEKDIKGSKVGSRNSVKEIMDFGEGKANSRKKQASIKAVRNGATREKKSIEKVISTYIYHFKFEIASVL